MIYQQLQPSYTTVQQSYSNVASNYNSCQTQLSPYLNSNYPQLIQACQSNLNYLMSECNILYEGNLSTGRKKPVEHTYWGWDLGRLEPTCFNFLVHSSLSPNRCLLSRSLTMGFFPECLLTAFDVDDDDDDADDWYLVGYLASFGVRVPGIDKNFRIITIYNVPDNLHCLLST